MAMDATAYWEQRNQRNAEERYKLGLERAATGEGILASLQGREAQAGPLAAESEKNYGIAQEREQTAYERSLDRARTGAGVLAAAEGKAKVQDRLDQLSGELARGGPALQHGAYLVGEKGPEIFVPAADGRVIPNHRLPGSLRRATGLEKLPGRASGGLVFKERQANLRHAAGLAAQERIHAADAEANRQTKEAEIRLREDAQRAEYFKNQNSPDKIAADAAREGSETARFKAQALAMYPGPDGKPDPRASQLIDLYAKTGMHLTSPQSAMEGIDQGMKIHKVVDSWADGTKLARLQGRLAPEAVAAIKEGNPMAILAAEERGFGNKHGLDPGVLAGKVKGSTLPEKISQGGVTPEMRARADEANKTGLQHIGGKWLNYTTDVNGQRQYQLSPVGNAPAVPKTATTATPSPAFTDPAMENWRTAGKVVRAIGEAPGNLIEAGLIRPINRAAEGLGSLAIQGARQLVPGAHKVFNEPTPTNPYGLQDVVPPAPATQPNLAIPIGPRRIPIPIEETSQTFYP